MSEILNSEKEGNIEEEKPEDSRKLTSGQSNASNSDEIVERLRAIFSFYASYGDRMNISHLKSNKFHKMMSDAQLETGIEAKKSLDIIFCSHNKHKSNMSFDVFINIIPDIAKFRYNSIKDETVAISKVIRENLLPLYDKYVCCSDAGALEQADVSITFEQEVIAIIKSIEPTLFEIYISYFPWEGKSTENVCTISAQSSKYIFRFLSQFDICPTIISKTQAFQIYQNIINTVSPLSNIICPKYKIGVSLSFIRFVDYLLKLSFTAYQGSLKESGRAYSLSDRFCFMLERMELSKGFTNLEKLTNKPHTSKVSLIPPNIIMKKITEKNEIEEAKSMVSCKVTQMSDEVPNDAYELINESYAQLLAIFKKYCLYGDPLNNSQLKSAKFVKMLQDCGLIENENSKDNTRIALKKVTADIIFAKITGSKTQPDSFGMFDTMSEKSTASLKSVTPMDTKRIVTHNRRMDFNQFLTSIIHIAFKITSDVSVVESVKIAINSLLQLNSNEPKEVTDPNVIRLMNILKNDDVVQFLSVVYQALLPYYLCYANSKRLISFNSLVKFCSDFDIFPDIVNKAKLMRFFETLKKIFQSTSEGKFEDLIDEHLFTEAIALCSFEVQYKEPEPSEVEKIIFLLERMSQSKGIQIAQKSSGNTRMNTAKYDLISVVRAKFPEYFMVKMPVTKVTKMQDMLSKGLIK